MPQPTLIVVSGPAGSGKTTLAHRLAAVIGCPAVCRDEIKEGLVRTAGPGFVPTLHDPLTLRTYDLFFDTLALLLDAGVTLVAEAAFQDPLWRRGLERLPAADVRVVRCAVPDALARSRITDRQATATARAAHADTGPVVAPSDFVPIALEVPTLDVDTSAGYEPTIEAVVAFLTTPPDCAQ